MNVDIPQEKHMSFAINLNVQLAQCLEKLKDAAQESSTVTELVMPFHQGEAAASFICELCEHLLPPSVDIIQS